MASGSGCCPKAGSAERRTGVTPATGSRGCGNGSRPCTDRCAPAVLILTTFDDDETVATALAAGAAGFLLKDAPGEDLIRATRTIGSGGAWLDPAVAGPVLEAYRSSALPRAQSAAKLAELTDR